MIKALINDETIAINTAKASALKTKLNPKGKFLIILIGWPLSAGDNNVKERIKEDNAAKKANLFLKPSEIFPKIGRINAPIMGIKTTRDNII